MSLTESILKSCIHELNVCQHLYTKFDPTNADWRPQANMRSTVELLQYLSYIGIATAKHFVNPPEDREAAREQYREQAKWSVEAVTFENTSEMIELEKDALRNLFSTITDDDLQRTTYHMFSNQEMSLFEALTNAVMKYLCAYRMQLFLYAKMCGAEINTRNNWYGMDSQRPAPVPETVAAVA